MTAPRLRSPLALVAIALLVFGLTPTATAAGLTPTGPGGRILGLDISRYQHSPTTPINFAKMAAAGVSFIYINGGNTLKVPDALAASYYPGDRQRAQSQGIYTGFYYYVHLPNSTKRSVILANADNQAHKVINRINASGGLNQLDLPVALDLESTCVKQTIFGFCLRHMSVDNTVLWVNRWVADVKSATGKSPVIYSFLAMLHGSLGGDSALVLNPLWVATAGISAATAGSQPAQLEGGCSSNVWTTSDCTLQWSIWQFSSGGNAHSYGIPTSAVDLNVFAGSAADFAAFAANGTPVPLQQAVMSPVETSTASTN